MSKETESLRTFRDRDDRTVHGRSHSGDYEIVRYDRSGKWYFEADDGSRVHVGVSHAAQVAAMGDFTPGLPGGQRFDKLVRDKRAEDASLNEHFGRKRRLQATSAVGPDHIHYMTKRPLTPEAVIATRPDLRPVRHGWMAISAPGSALRVAVIGLTERDARDAFVRELDEWALLAALPEAESSC